MIAAQTGIQMQHIAYKGSAPGLVDLAAGQTQSMTDTINTALPYIRDGRLRAIAVTSLKRSSVLPDVPSLHEAGLTGFDAAAWQGIVVPTGTPAEIISRLNAEVNKALGSDLRQRLVDQGYELSPASSEDFAKFQREDIARSAKIVADAKIKAE